MQTTTFLKEQRSDIVKVDPRSLVSDETFNVREDYGDLDELAASILENGVKQPLRGYRKGEMIHITDGFRRNAAVSLLIEKGKITVDDGFRIPVLLETKGYRVEDRYFDMFITQDNKQLAPVEIANLFYKLHHGYNTPVADIAKKVGKSVPYVYEMLKLAEAPKEIRDAVVEKKITHRAAIEVVKTAETPQEATAVVEKAITKAKKEKKGATVKIGDVKEPKERKPKERDVPKGNLAILRELEELVLAQEKRQPGTISSSRLKTLQYIIECMATHEFAIYDAIQFFFPIKRPNNQPASA